MTLRFSEKDSPTISMKLVPQLAGSAKSSEPFSQQRRFAGTHQNRSAPGSTAFRILADSVPEHLLQQSTIRERLSATPKNLTATELSTAFVPSAGTPPPPPQWSLEI